MWRLRKTDAPCLQVMSAVLSVTDIALRCSQGTRRSQLDVQKFQEGYMCKSCFREIERLSVHEKQARELKGATNTSLPSLAHQTLCLSSGIQVSSSKASSSELETPAMLTACCLDPTRVAQEIQVIIDQVEKSGDLIGRDKILLPAQLRVRDATRPFPL